MKKKQQRYTVLILLCIGLLILLCGCVTPATQSAFIKNGKEYGKVKGAFRNRWWNFYERGLSFSEGEFHKEAAADFSEAIRQRENDQRMARTYGMHFVDYFPHRELGIVLYETGQLQAAKKELELSLSQFPSAKARFYLDRVRKALLEQQSLAEQTSPRFEFAHRADELWTRDDPVVISGVVEDRQYIDRISLAGIPLFLEGANQRVPFSKALRLAQGRHVVNVEAGNLLGRVTRQQIIIHVDREGPQISLFKVTPSTGGMTTVSGSAYDDNRVQEVRINDRPIVLQKGVEVFFDENIMGAKGELKITASDSLGNQTSASVSLGPILSRRASPLLASADKVNSWLLAASIFGPKDTRPPDIKLKGWTEKQTVFLDKVYIEGQVSDDNHIVSLSVNQQAVLKREGQTIFFSNLEDLKEGENTITVETRDKAGNAAVKKIMITRKIPKALQLQERMSLTVFPFDQKGNISDANLSFQDNLINSLANRERFRLVERDRLDMILQEQKLSQTQLVDPQTALKLGKLVAAASVLTGSIIETRKGIEIVARMVDTETAEILETEDVYEETKDLATLKKLSEGLAIKFHLDFPLLDGLIVQQKEQAIFTDLGKDKIKINRRLIVYREEPIKHPVTGKVLGADNVIIGRARVVQVMSDLSKAMISTGDKITVKPLDKVITE